MAKMTKDEINKLSHESELLHLDPYELNERIYTFPQGGFVFFGRIFSPKENRVIERFSLIPETNYGYQIMEESIVLEFRPMKQSMRAASKSKKPNQYLVPIIPTNQNQLNSSGVVPVKVEQPPQQINAKNGFHLQSLNRPVGDSDQLEDKRVELSVHYNKQVQSRKDSMNGSFMVASVNQSYVQDNGILDQSSRSHNSGNDSYQVKQTNLARANELLKMKKLMSQNEELSGT